MAIDKAPAYQMYARDWLGSRNVRLMQDFQRGWYIQLLNEAWDNDPQGMLPNDQALLMQLAGVTDARKSEPAFNQCWAAVIDRFEVDGAWVFNAKQLAQVADQIAYRERQSRAGTASAKAKAERKAEVARLLQNANNGLTTVEPPLNHGSIPVVTETQPDLNSPPAPAPAPAILSIPVQPQAIARFVPFDEFWKIWNHRKAKADAIKAWAVAKIDEATFALIRSDLKDRTQRDPTWAKGMFMLPGTYIRGKRWEDEQPGKAPAIGDDFFKGCENWGN